MAILLAIYVTSYSSLASNYNQLNNNYHTLYNSYNLALAVKMPDGLDQHYEQIRAAGYQNYIYKSPGWVTFYVSQVLHDLGNYSYYPQCSDYDSTFNVSCKNVTTAYAQNLLSYIIQPGSNLSKIEQIYDWCCQNIHYCYDISDFPRFPIETISLGYGDCEDQAMALSFLLESAGYQTAICQIYDQNFTSFGTMNYTGGFNHVFCLVKLTNFEYNGTVIQLTNPHYDGNWIMLDSTWDGPFNSDPAWLQHYRLANGTLNIPFNLLNYLAVDTNELNRVLN